jgi:release factor glutamine methyltransferase
MPVSMKLRRTIRPLVFRLVLPILRHRLKKNADTELEGMKLRTNLDVFHPKYFFSSRILGGYVAECVERNHRVLDMGTGSGLVGIMAAKRGAQVLAVDINPAAVTLANENAFRQNLNGHWRCVESDLFARLDPVDRFDWDMPLASLDGRFQRHGYRVVDHQSRRHLFEIFHLLQLGINILDSK